MATHALKLKAPQVPNYIFLDMPVGRRQDGFEAPKMDVAMLTDEQLREIGAEWLDALIKNAHARRSGGQDVE